MNLTTTVARNMHNVLVAETVIQLGADRRELRIQTRKDSHRGGLQSTARVVQVSECGERLHLALRAVSTNRVICSTLINSVASGQEARFKIFVESG